MPEVLTLLLLRCFYASYIYIRYLMCVSNSGLMFSHSLCCLLCLFKEAQKYFSIVLFHQGIFLCLHSAHLLFSKSQALCSNSVYYFIISVLIFCVCLFGGCKELWTIFTLKNTFKALSLLAFPLSAQKLVISDMLFRYIFD